MKYMLAWKIAPGHIKSAAEAFLKAGAPTPKGLTLIGLARTWLRIRMGGGRGK
jgi:hypothetical protein